MAADTIATIDQIEELKAERDYWREQAETRTNAERLAMIRHRLEISRTEAWILATLYDRGDRPASFTSMADNLPNSHRDEGNDLNTLRVFVCRLRAKFGRDIIETIKGAGYRLGAGWRDRWRGIMDAPPDIFVVLMHKLALTATEARVLIALYEREDRPISFVSLPQLRLPDLATLRVHACYLRMKLGCDVIETVKGVGYRLGSGWHERIAAL